MSFLTAIALLLAFFEVTSSLKENRILVPAFVMISGNLPKDGKACSAGIQIAADAANARSDILPGYFISVDFRDEGDAGLMSVAGTARYGLSDNRIDNITTKSPVVIGAWNTDGCKSTATFYHHFGLIGFHPSCVGTPVDSNRKIYPNLYRIRVPIELALFAEIKFIREVGKWEQIAILTNAVNSRDIYDSRELEHLFERYNVKAAWARYVIWVDDETVRSLKESNLRIVLVEETDTNFVVSFFCMAYKYGITGPRYIFIVQTCGMCNPLTDVTAFPDQCGLEILTEQMKITYWIGGYVFSGKNYGQITLGYDKEGFEQRFDQKTNKARTADYMTRQSCHDTMLQAILTLDAAEKALRPKILTLKDFAGANFSAVAAAVNDSAPTIKYNSIHTGFQQYSSRLEMDDEQQAILRWDAKAGSFELIYEIHRDKRFAVPDLNGYNFTQMSPRPWLTKDNNPPKDFPKKEIHIQSKEQASTISALEAVTVIVAAAEFAGFLRYFKSPSASLPQLQKAVFAFGCLFLKMAIFCILEQTTGTTGHSLCFLRVFFWSIGISLINGTLALRIIVFWQEIRNLKLAKKQTKLIKAAVAGGASGTVADDTATNGPTSSSTGATADSKASKTSSSQQQMSQATIEKLKKAKREADVAALSKTIWGGQAFVTVGYTGLIVANLIVLICWEAIETYISSTVQPVERNHYHYESDTFVTLQVSNCSSANDMVALVVLSCIHFAVILLGVALTMFIGKSVVVADITEAKFICLACVNIAGCFMIVIFAYIVTDIKLMSGQVTTVVFILFLSIMSFTLTTLPSMRSLFPNSRSATTPTPSTASAMSKGTTAGQSNAALGQANLAIPSKDP